MSVHDGHRKRMRKRFFEQGLDGFDEHQVLEVLLYFAVARKDTNELAHALIAKFGSLSRVLEAPIPKLMEVPGIGENAAALISFSSALSRYYMFNKVKESGSILSSIEDCGAYLLPLMINRETEVVYLLCLDAKCKLLCSKMIGEGSVNSAGIPIRKIVETALAANATSVVLAHNHPSGLAFPSNEDINTTKLVSTALRAVDVILTDHLVFADHDYVSMTQSGFYDPKASYTLI